MEIHHNGKIIYSVDMGRNLTILIDGNEYKVRWGRTVLYDPGKLPFAHIIPKDDLETVLTGFEYIKVPILADAYRLSLQNHSHLVTLRKDQYISGVLAKAGREKRVYVVGGYRDGIGLVPKVLSLPKSAET